LNALLLAKWFPRARVVGIDIDPAVLEIARRCAEAAGSPNLKFELASADHIEQTGRAELVVCIDVLEHVVDDVRLATEVLDLVAHGGNLVVHVPLRNQHYAFSAVRRTMLQAIEEGRDPHVREGYREADLRRLFAKDFERFETKTTLGGLASVVADLEALSALKQTPLPRIVGLPLLPWAGHSGGRWSKGVLGVGRDCRS
jgi:2-polyprenyl-3-methyl-5-hydroxy-6-metoxy-1,4-benzoquinol methylase